jgi:hypothetical protein
VVDGDRVVGGEAVDDAGAADVVDDDVDIDGSVGWASTADPASGGSELHAASTDASIDAVRAAANRREGRRLNDRMTSATGRAR